MAAVVDPALMALAEEEFFNQPAGFPFGEFSMDDVLLPPDDDMGIRDDEDEEDDEEEVQQETGFGSVVVVDGLPVIPKEKFEKLESILMKLLSKVGTVRDRGMMMPMDESEGKSKGFAFVEFSRQEEAANAVVNLNEYRLDKNHVLTVYPIDEIDRYAKVPDEYVSPEVKPYEAKDGMYTWLMDGVGRDQFVIRYQSETEIYWNDAKRYMISPVHQRSFWTESFVQWSAKGSMLATIHRQGVALWGCQSFGKITRFSHPEVQLLDFSKNEKYLVTYSPMPPVEKGGSPQCMFIVWDIFANRKLRTFQGPLDEFAVGSSAVGASGGSRGLEWPLFKWAGGKEDKFVAKLTRGGIQVYNCEDMTLHEKKPYKLDGVHDFQWSPEDTLLCAYQAELGNMPARVSLVRFPERTEVRQKTLFSVQDAKIIWHPQGNYLAVQVNRFTKTRKSTNTAFELFRIREKNIPMEVLELPNKAEKIIAFAWEPHGHRFAIVHGDGPRPSVSFYSMQVDAKMAAQGVKLLGSLQNQQCSSLFWSPAGRHILLAGLKGFQGQLQFFNVDDMQAMSVQEHFMCTDVEWDPTGRYLATAVTSVNEMENGFSMWTFNGQQYLRVMKNSFYQLSWRPRPPSLLPPEKLKEISKNLKSYSKRYEQEDEAMMQQADSEVLVARQRMMDEWLAWKERKAPWVEKMMEGARQLCGDKLDEPEYEMEMVEVEQTISEKAEPYQS